MKSLPNLIAHLGPIAERYLTLLRVHPTNTYNYEKRGYTDLQVIEVDQHGPKCRQGESWLYFAVPSQAKLASLLPADRLYIGAQTQDRMFRGDRLNGNNYHHWEMRAGNGDDAPVAFLTLGQQIAIYRVAAERIAALVSREPSLSELRILISQRRTPKMHLAWWFEQYVLFSEPKQWRWNTVSADKSLAKIFAA